MGAYGIAGDPGGMIQLAGLLRDVASSEETDAGRLSRTLDGMVYAGPAADRFRGAMAWTQLQRGGVVARLEELADRLVRAAAEVEQQQEDAKRRLERLAAERDTDPGRHQPGRAEPHRARADASR